jgi:hypothetical protein
MATKRQLVIKAFEQIDKELKTPLIPLLKIINASRSKNRLSYELLYDTAISGKLLDKQLNDLKQYNGVFQNLQSTYSEAVALSSCEANKGIGIAIYEPGDQATQLLIDALKGLKFVDMNSRQEYIKKIRSIFGRFTPDILVYAPTYEVVIGKDVKIISPTIKNAINPDSSYDVSLQLRRLYKLMDYLYYKKNLTAAFEVTLSKRSDEIREKIEKFQKYNGGILKGVNKFVPSLVLDLQGFYYTGKIKDNHRLEFVNSVYGSPVYGVIQLIDKLSDYSEYLSKSAATQLYSFLKSQPAAQSSITPSLDNQMDSKVSKNLQLYFTNGQEKELLDTIFKQVAIQSSKGKTLTPEESNKWLKEFIDPFILAISEINSSIS